MNPIAANSAISQIGQIQDAARNLSTAGAGKPGAGGGFAELIQDYVKQTNNDQLISDAAIEDFATGKSDNIDQVVFAMANADMSFQLFMEIRNKLIDSYNELMRMQF